MKIEKNYCDVHFDTEMVDVGHHGVEEFVCPECFKEVKQLRIRVAELENQLWVCGCGTVNGVNLSHCRVCNRGGIENREVNSFPVRDYSKENIELWTRLFTLLKASEGMEKALEVYAEEDEGQGLLEEEKLAKQALADFRAVKETMDKGAGNGR